jgi:hypothetical protein
MDLHLAAAGESVNSLIAMEKIGYVESKIRMCGDDDGRGDRRRMGCAGAQTGGGCPSGRSPRLQTFRQRQQHLRRQDSSTPMLTVTPFSQYLATHAAAAELSQSVGDVPTLIVQWDRAPGSLWAFRVCEYYGVGTARWDYPAPVDWIAAGSAQLAYAKHPVSTDSSIQGRSSVVVRPDGDAMSVEVTLRNDSPDTWHDSWGWLCLIHRWAGSFQANCELPTGPDDDDPWLPCASLRAPLGRWLKWCVVRQHQPIAERICRGQAHMWQPHIRAARGAVRAWRMLLNEPVQQLVELSSDQAIILGWSHWPCTDMGLYFGDLAPGQQRSVSGFLRFFEKPYTRV